LTFDFLNVLSFRHVVVCGCNINSEFEDGTAICWSIVAQFVHELYEAWCRLTFDLEVMSRITLSVDKLCT